MFIIDSVDCVYDEADRMFHADARDTLIDLLDPPSKIAMDDHGAIKLRFSLVTSELGKGALYHALWLPLGEHRGLIPMKQYYLIVE